MSADMYLECLFRDGGIAGYQYEVSCIEEVEEVRVDAGAEGI